MQAGGKTVSPSDSRQAKLSAVDRLVALTGAGRTAGASAGAPHRPDAHQLHVEHLEHLHRLHTEHLEHLHHLHTEHVEHMAHQQGTSPAAQHGATAAAAARPKKAAPAPVTPGPRPYPRKPV